MPLIKPVPSADKEEPLSLPELLGCHLCVYLREKDPLDQRIQEFIDNGADLNAQLYGADPLSTAVSRNHVSAVELLLKNNASVHNRDDLQRTALMYAKDIKIAELLVAAGADIDAIDKQNNSALHHFADFNLPENMALLLASGSEMLNAQGFSKRTPLYTALQHYNFEAAFYLLDRPGVDPRIPTKENYTAKTLLQSFAMKDQQEKEPQTIEALVTKIETLEKAFNVAAVMQAVDKPLTVSTVKPRLTFKKK